MTGAVLIGYRYGITLWDWIKLLIVPAVIAGGGLWFNAQQRDREQQIANARTQDEALQAYLDQMGQLLLDKERPLRQSKEGDEVRTLARARTLTLLSRLEGGEGKRSVLQFLYESGLIVRARNVLDVRGADLRGADLLWANLEGAILTGANLDRAWVDKADLLWANLRGARLSEARLNEANLSHAILLEASVSGADLRGANLRGTFLRGADLAISEEIKEVTDLTGADLTGTDLKEANLYFAQGVTNEQLQQQAESLEGATMPDGQKYEEWLESKGRGEDGENGSPS